MDVESPDVVFNEWIGKFVEPRIEFPDRIVRIEEFKDQFHEILSDEDKFREIVEKLYSMGMLFGDPYAFIVGYLMRATMEDECQECKERRGKITIETLIPTEEDARRYQATRLRRTGSEMIEFSKKLMEGKELPDNPEDTDE